MRYLGLDYGDKNIGISISDLTQTIASPIGTIINNVKVFENINKLIIEHQITTVILGLPKNMNNTIGDRALKVIQFKEELEKYLNINVELQDERRTTIEANNYMLEADLSRRKRKNKIDGLAAAIILQTYLNKKKGN